MDEIALALGGGGVKGIAHIGVIRVLEQEGFDVRAVAGTSAGGLVGALLASGCTSYQIEKALNGLSNPHLFSRSPNDGPALVGLQGLNQLLLNEIDDLLFDELKIPFACTSVDLHTNQEVILAQGSVLDALMATVAVPGIFPPRQIGQYSLIDGGVLDPVPVALARWLAPSMPIIAVCLQSVPEKWAHLHQQSYIPAQTPIPRPLLDQFAKMRLGQAFQIFVSSFDITTHMLAELRMQQDHPDVIIRPDVDKFALFDLVDPAELISLGEAAARQALPEIRQALSWSNQLSRYFRHSDLPGKVLPTTME
jgi:NTE family protein